MAFDGTEGENVSLDDAARWTANFRTENEGAAKGHFLGRNILSNILEQEGCDGIRFYNAIDDEGKYCIVATGADSRGDDQIDEGHTIAERSLPCPPYCGKGNVLNQ